VSGPGIPVIQGGEDVKMGEAGRVVGTLRQCATLAEVRAAVEPDTRPAPARPSWWAALARALVLADVEPGHLGTGALRPAQTARARSGPDDTRPAPRARLRKP
jgi:hypothetical protein